MIKAMATVGFFLLIIIFSSCGEIGREQVFSTGLVVSSDKIASEVGLQALKQGGNAVDAACAAALALGVTYPWAGNIGGGGFAMIYIADSQDVYFLDFRESAPQSSVSDMYLDSSGDVDDDKILFGPSASGVPGTIAGLSEMHRLYGDKKWSDLVRPARLLADTGFLIGEDLASSFAEYEQTLRRFPATEAVFFPEGRPLQPRERLIQSDLGATLAAVEVGGRDAFYRGETAQKIADYCADNGGRITMSDLENYQTRWHQPVRFKFRGLDIYCPGLPSSGGIVMGQILGILESFELEKYQAQSPEYIHLFTEAARQAYADRSEYLGDPDFTIDMTDELLDKNYITNRLKSIDADHASSSTEILPGLPRSGKESDQTTHLVVVDNWGNVVSLTYTINLSYGCKAIVPGAGFLLNNEMDDFSSSPGKPNSFGLVGGEANKIEAGKRMLSSMTPTIVIKSGRPYLALGSPGGSKIITAVAQIIINYHIYGMTVGEAVAAPRFHHQWLPDLLYMEQGGYDITTIQKLIGMGHNIKERSRYSEVMAVEFSPDGKFFIGAADPRGPGHIAGY